MAVLRLELDIDSEVHPELYARLASLERLPAREEKLRQLAATGLIWEIVRLHGPAFVDPAAVSAPGVAVPDAVPVAPAAPAAPVVADARVETAAREAVPAPAPTIAAAPWPPTAQEPAASPSSPAPEPAARPPEVAAVDAGTLDDHALHVPENVPVLHDVVDETEMADASPIDAAAAEAALARVMSLSKPVPPSIETVSQAPARAPAPSIEPAGGKARSARMKRMKDSGLFQNG